MPIFPRLSRFARPAAALLSAAAFFAARPAAATDSRYREFVVGERSAGMGGATLAIARDVDAIYANPAGLAASQHDSISLSANLYGLESYSVRNGLAHGDDASSSSFVTVPSAMGGVLRLSPDWVAGFGIFTPKQEQSHIVASREGNSRFYNLSASDQTMRIGPAIAWHPAASRLSVGAALFGVYRDISENQSRYVAGQYNVNLAAELKTIGLLASLGARLDLGSGWTLGANVQSPNLRVHDEGKISVNVFGHDPGAELAVYSSSVDADNRIPWQLALGIGRESPGRWAFALDTLYHPSTSYALASWVLDDTQARQTLHLHSVLDVSLGGEIVFAERYPVRAGVYTAFSAARVPTDPASTELATSDVDMYGVTFSVGRRKDHVSVNLGFDYAFGHGHDLGLSDNDEQVPSPCNREVFLCSLSTVYHF